MNGMEYGPVVGPLDLLPDRSVFRIWVSQKHRKLVRNGEEVMVPYWEGAWDVPVRARAEGDRRKRPQITASSMDSAKEAEARCRQKVFEFFVEQMDEAQQAQHASPSARRPAPERAASYTVKSFLEEWFAAHTNPNTDAQNRWAPGTARGHRQKLDKWIYPYLGDVALTDLTHEQVRRHFQETLPNQVTRTGKRILSDPSIRNVYTTLRAGLMRAGAKRLLPEGEFLKVGIKTSFGPSGVGEDVDHLMWEMNALLQRPDVIEDPRAVRWALAFPQALRRGERGGLKWSDIDWDAGKLTVQRQLTYEEGLPEYLTDRLKANEKRRIDISPITRPILEAAFRRRQDLERSPNWNPRPDFADLILLRDDGSAANLNDDSDLWQDFVRAYAIDARGQSSGKLRQASATFWAGYGGSDGRGVSRELLRKFLGHSAKSNMDAYYTRTSDEAMSREFSTPPPVRASDATPVQTSGT